MDLLLAEGDRAVEVVAVPRHGRQIDAELEQLDRQLACSVGAEVEEDRGVAAGSSRGRPVDDDREDELVGRPARSSRGWRDGVRPACPARRSRRARAASAPSAGRGPSRSSGRRPSRSGPAGSSARSRTARRRRHVAPVGEGVDPRPLGHPSRSASSSSARRWSMCEWTPPYETRPSRWTSPPRSRARRNAPTSASFSKSEPSRTARFTRWRSWSRTRPLPIVRWPTSELPIWPGGRPTASPEASSVVRGPRAQSASKTGVRGELDRVARTGRRAAPPVQDDERYERTAVSQIAANESTSSEAPPTSAPSTFGCERSSSAFSGLTEPP